MSSYYFAVISSIGRAETAQAPPNAGVFARPDEEITSSTVTTTTVDPTPPPTGSGKIFHGIIK